MRKLRNHFACIHFIEVSIIGIFFRPPCKEWRIASPSYIHVIFVDQIFGTIGLSPNEEISRWNNFQTFVDGLTLLFRFWPQLKKLQIFKKKRKKESINL